MNRSTTSLLTLISLFCTIVACTPNATPENHESPSRETAPTQVPTIELATPLPNPQIVESTIETSDSAEINNPSPTETAEPSQPIVHIESAWEPQLVKQIGGDQRILATQGNLLYVGVGNFLQVFDITDATQPTLLHMQQAYGSRETYIGSMVINGRSAALTIHGFHPGWGFRLMVDLSNPRAPIVIPNDDPPHSLYVVGKDEIVIQVTGFVNTKISLLQIKDEDITPLRADHPFRQQLLSQAAAQIAQDSNNTISPTPENVSEYIGDVELRGDLLVLSWEDLPCHARDTSSEVICYAGILLFDISNLQTPTLIHAITLDEEQWIHGLTNTGILTHYGRQSQTTQQIDLKPFLPNPEILPLDTPEFNQLDSLAGVHPRKITRYGDFGYLIGENPTISIVDLSQLPSITLVGQLELPTVPSEINVSHGLLAVNSKDRIDIFDLNTPSQPTLIYTHDERGMTDAINTSEFLVYGLDSKLKLIPKERLTNPQSTRPLTEVNLEGEIKGILGLNEPYIYLLVDHPVSSRIVVIVDTTNPKSSPNVFSDIQGDEIIDLAPYPQLGIFQDGLFFTNCDLSRICIFEVGTRPDQPQLLGHTTQCHIHIQEATSQTAPTWHQQEEILELTRPISSNDALTYNRIGQKLCFHPTAYADPDIDSIVLNGYWIRAEHGEGLTVYQSSARE